MCSLPLNTKHFTVLQSQSMEIINMRSSTSISQTSLQPHEACPISWTALLCILEMGMQSRITSLQGSQEIGQPSCMVPLLHSSWAELRHRAESQLLHKGCSQYKKSFLSNQMKAMCSLHTSDVQIIPQRKVNSFPKPKR